MRWNPPAKIPNPPSKCGGMGCEECYGRSSRPCEWVQERLGVWAEEHLYAWGEQCRKEGAAVAFGLTGMAQAIRERPWTCQCGWRENYSDEKYCYACDKPR